MKFNSRNIYIRDSLRDAKSLLKNDTGMIANKNSDIQNQKHLLPINSSNKELSSIIRTLLNVFNSKYFYNKNILIFSDDNIEISENIIKLGGKVSILYLTEKPIVNQKAGINIASINEIIISDNKFDVALYNTDNLELLQKYISEIYKKCTDLIICQASAEAERYLLDNKINNIIKLTSPEDDKNFYFSSKRKIITNQISKKYIVNKQNIVPIIDVGIEKPLNTNINLQVYHTIPWDTTKNLGAYYNKFMSLLQDEDWACFLDGDAVHTTTYFGKYIEDIIRSNPEYGLFTCNTNRIGCKYQIPSNVDWSNDSQKYHRELGDKLWSQYKTKVLDITDNTPLSGVLILINKGKWNEVGGFKEDKMLSVDNDIHLRFRNAGFKVGLMQGIYVQHWYRGGKQKEKFHLL